MFIVDYFGFKHVKYSNTLHVLTFYTTPKGDKFPKSYNSGGVEHENSRSTPPEL